MLSCHNATMFIAFMIDILLTKSNHLWHCGALGYIVNCINRTSTKPLTISNIICSEYGINTQKSITPEFVFILSVVRLLWNVLNYIFGLPKCKFKIYINCHNRCAYMVLKCYADDTWALCFLKSRATRPLFQQRVLFNIKINISGKSSVLMSFMPTIHQ